MGYRNTAQRCSSFGFNCTLKRWTIDIDGERVADFATKREGAIAYYGSLEAWEEAEDEYRRDRWEEELFYN